MVIDNPSTRVMSVLSDELHASSWQNISEAIKFYIENGFSYKNVPWTVPKHISMITCPDRNRTYTTNTAVDLVGSSEQSFLWLHELGDLPRGKYVTCTPCFRNEPVIDILHQTNFMKVELFANEVADEKTLHNIIDTAYTFFSSLKGHRKSLAIEKTDDGFDITNNGIEIGSYGIRHHANLSWIYGTGIAEPRFTTSISL